MAPTHSHPTDTLQPDHVSDVVAGVLDRTVATAQATLFWVAVLLAPVTVTVLLFGLAELPVVGGLAVANALALLGGHDHHRGGAQG